MTYPLDTVRLRMAVDQSIRTMPQSVRILAKEGGIHAFYRGVGPAMYVLTSQPRSHFHTSEHMTNRQLFAHTQIGCGSLHGPGIGHLRFPEESLECGRGKPNLHFFLKWVRCSNDVVLLDISPGHSPPADSTPGWKLIDNARHDEGNSDK